jgi:integrase
MEQAPPLTTEHEETCPMAGTVRKRSWTTRQGEIKTAWTADYFDQQRNRHTKQFPTKKAANAWLLQARVEVRAGTHTPEADSITVAEAGRLWLERGKTEGLERTTLHNYEGVLRLHIVPQLGRVRLAQLTATAVEAYRDTLVKTLSRRSAREALKFLNAILKNAERRGLVAHNAAASVTPVKPKGREREMAEIGHNVPSKAEVQAIIAAADKRWRPVFVTAAFTGMRASELRGLEWNAVDLKNRVIHVRQRADYYNKLGPPKSAAGRRDIPLMPIVVNTLREWKAAYPCGPDGLVFCVVHHGAKGSVVHHQIMWLAYRRAQRRAGVTDAAGQPKYHFHVLRHFFASIGIEAGFAPKRLQAVLGHASITMTYDVYGHLFPNPEDDYTRLAAMERGVFGK